jgi:DNA primase
MLLAFAAGLYTKGMDAVSEVKSRINIEDVLGEYVQLKRSGRNFKGLSPFSNEKTASFMVSPEKQIWHDFSSGKGGDVFTFVQEVEGLDFRGALEFLARKAGVDLEQFSSGQSRVNTKFKDRALEALELAAKFYQKQLTANKPAVEYLLKDRKFTKQTLLDWRLGYAPSTGQALTTFLTKNGFETDEMKRSGLVFERRNGLSDMFRGRIMIPLCDARGSVIGFTARLLADEPDAPKYINTPQTLTYDKGRNVFGLHLAKEAIRKSGFVVVVEGNMDVIASNQAGVTNVVASAGTAMTEMHLRELKKFTGDIRLCFDADRAGINATERIIPIAQKVEVNLKIVSIKGAKDPDELIQKDVDAWQKAIDSAVYAPDWLIGQYTSELDLKSAEGKRAFTDILLTTIRRLRDPVEQEHYLKKNRRAYRFKL